MVKVVEHLYITLKGDVGTNKTSKQYMGKRTIIQADIYRGSIC